MPESWSYVDDVALTLAAVARDERSWGRPWHVPSTVMSLRDIVDRLAEATNSRAPQLVPMSRTDLAWGASDPIMAKLIEIFCSLEHPDVLDSVLTQRTFGLPPTPMGYGARRHGALRRHRLAAVPRAMTSEFRW